MANHCFSSMFYHLVWSTQYREPNIKSESKDKLHYYIKEIISRKEWHPVAVGGIDDHVHILIQKAPKYTISDVVCCIKSNSSRFMSENFVKDFAWQHGYSVFTVDQRSIDRVKGYILNQELHHKKMSFEEEYIALLKRNCIKYNAKYISKRQFFE